MSNILSKLSEYLDSADFDVIRISEADSDGKIDTLERIPGNPCQNTYSVAKAFTMTAIGLLYDKGVLDVSDKICDILRDDIDYDIDPRWNDVTIEMALTHTLGLPGGFLDIDVNDSAIFGKDYLKYTLTYPMAYTPGTENRYSDGAYYLLSRVVEKKVSDTTDNYLWKELLFDIGFQEMAWSHCPMGHCMGATGLYISSKDMAKLGVLYLNGGIYNGKQFLSQKWVDMVLEKDYSLGWNETHDFFSKGGMCGQSLMVVPKIGKVFAIQSFGGNTKLIAEEILKNI